MASPEERRCWFLFGRTATAAEARNWSSGESKEEVPPATDVRRVVDGLDVFLLPNAQYWIRFENEVGQARLGFTNSGGEDAGGVAGWSIGEQPLGFYSGSIRVGLSGFAVAAGSSEPSGGDLAASQHTTGSVRVGQVSYGNLFVDDRVGVGAKLVSVESFTRDRDWFKLVGLQRGRLYRVEVDFRR